MLPNATATRAAQRRDLVSACIHVDARDCVSDQGAAAICRMRHSMQLRSVPAVPVPADGKGEQPTIIGLRPAHHRRLKPGDLGGITNRIHHQL